MPKIKLVPWQLLLAAGVFIVAANNGGLFAALGAALDLSTADGMGFLLTITLLMLAVVNTLLLVLGCGRLLKPVLVVFFVTTSIFSYFSNDMGVAFHEDMLLNIAETIRDNNPAEALELASVPFLSHLLLVGFLPSLLLLFVDVVPQTFLREVGSRSLVAMVGALLVMAAAMPNYKYVTYFAIEHRDLRFKVMPVFPIMSLVRLTQDAFHHDAPFKAIDEDARQRLVSANRTIGIMVVGETARADHFSLNGYAKATNRLLEQQENLLFAHGNSCGTSTLFSVPCMFSMRTRGDYDPDIAASESNVLDILTAAGVKSVWIENNSSCKHVCDRIETLDLRRDPDEASPYYSDLGYLDEILLEKVDQYLDSDGPDQLIVLHTLGSHGPAYSRRFPPSFGTFSPYCDKISPRNCSDELVSNAYDNTLVYTDFILDRLIEKLKARADEFDSFLFYASDHGESLGEGGVYLHGLPYALAPQAQTDVPFVAWLSSGFKQSRGIGQGDIRHFTAERPSHDNISHTLLGLFDVDATTYVQELDLFANPDGVRYSSASSTLQHPTGPQRAR